MASEDHSEVISAALKNEDIPNIYFNGFTVSTTANDILIVLKRSENAVAVLNASHIIAKSLVELMGNIIVDFEERTGAVIMTNDQILKRLTESVKDD